MESATHKFENTRLPDGIDPDPHQYDVLDGQIFLKDDRLSYIDGFDADKYPMQISPSYESPNAKFKGSLRGYTGEFPHMGPAEDDWSEKYPPQRIAMRGYSGFLPMTQNVYGRPIIPSIEAQIEAKSPQKTMTASSSLSPSFSPSRYSSMNRTSGHVPGRFEQSTFGSAMTNFRTAHSRDALEERYLKAVRQLEKRNQSQQQLCRILQTKMAERIKFHADQILRGRKMFHYFDMDGDGTLNEDEFRQFLELSNVIFDDIQALALFAAIDSKFQGLISWEDFESCVLVQDPQIGHYVVPKTNASPKSEHWKSMGLGHK